MIAIGLSKARRAGVELQLHIDRHQRRLRKRVRLATPTELADRRRAFRLV